MTGLHEDCVFLGATQEILVRESKLPEWIHLVPFGTWKGHHTLADVEILREDGDTIVRNFLADHKLVPIDFEHQTEHAGENGKEAPAQAWIDRLEVRADGVWGHVAEWLEPAATYVRTRKYRYVSPVVRWQAVDRVTGKRIGPRLSSVALTNIPFFSGVLTPLVSSNRASPRGPMNLLTLLLPLLSLPEDGTEQQVVDKVTELVNGPPATASAPAVPPAIQARANFGEKVLGALSWAKPPPNGVERIAAAMGKGDVVLAADHKALQDEVNQLRAENITLKAGDADKSVEALVARGRAEGRLTPAIEPDLRLLAKSDLKAAERLLGNLPKLTDRQVKEPATDPAAAVDALVATLSAADIAHCDKYKIDKPSYALQVQREKKAGAR